MCYIYGQGTSVLHMWRGYQCGPLNDPQSENYAGKHGKVMVPHQIFGRGVQSVMKKMDSIGSKALGK